MLKDFFRFTTVLVLLQSLLFPSFAAPRVQEKPTPLETRQAQQLSDLFVKRLEETGDLSSVIDELYVEDFIWRYIREQQRNLTETNSSTLVFFAPDLNCKASLLTQATEQDWRRLYVATYNFYYHVMVIGLNLYAADLINDNTTEEEILEKLLPPQVRSLLDAHPILKNVFEQKGESKVIESPEEMRNASDTLEYGLRLLLDGQASHMARLSEQSKQALKKLWQIELPAPNIEVSDRESFDFPAGTRMLRTLTPFLFGLTLVKVKGGYKIVWAELSIEI